VILHVIRFGFRCIKLGLGRDHRRNWQGNIGEIVDHHMALVLTLGIDVSLRSGRRHSRRFSYVTRWWPFEGGRIDANCIGRGRCIIDPYLTRKLDSRWSYSP